jgi:hypothetical protein
LSDTPLSNPDDPGSSAAGPAGPPLPPPGGQPTAYEPAPAGQAGYPGQVTRPFYQSSGVPAGYPAQGWPAGYAPAPARQSPGFGLRLTSMLLAIAGAVGIVVACLVPYAHFPPQVSGQSSPSILNPGPPDALKWFAAEPVAVALVVLVAGIVLLVSGSQGARWTTAGVLLAFGIQTPLLFAGYLFATALGTGFHHGPAGTVGILAGLLVLAAGITGLAGAAAGARAAAAGRQPAAAG